MVFSFVIFTIICFFYFMTTTREIQHTMTGELKKNDLILPQQISASIFVSCCQLKISVILLKTDLYEKIIEKINEMVIEKFKAIEKPCYLHTRLYEIVFSISEGVDSLSSDHALYQWKLSPANFYNIFMKTKTTEYIFLENNKEWQDFIH